MMTEQDVEQLAGQIADRLHASVLKIPASVAEDLKPYSGWKTRTMICGGNWPIAIETTITADGGIQLRVTDTLGNVALERVLSP